MAGRSFFAWRYVTAAGAEDERNRMAHLRSSGRASFDPINDLSETEFRNRYRLSKEAVEGLCKELKQLTELRSSQRVTLEVKVLTALFFFASGSYQRPVGVAKHVSQKTCSMYIEQVTQALTHSNMLKKYIKFPSTPAARQAISQRFYIKYGVPGVIGCIDGSHFKIVAPPREEEHSYYSRKHCHTLNVQMICDDEYRILNVNPKFGGANHDSFVWENSNLNSYMQSLHQAGEIVWLLGDSGYPQRPWLMTPFQDATPGTPQANFNHKHVATRVVIENTFGRLKNRWRCLHKDRVLHYKPLKCAKIIQACCVLHNIGLNFGIVDMQDDVNLGLEVEPNFTADRGDPASSDLLRGRALRDQLSRRLVQ